MNLGSLIPVLWMFAPLVGRVPAGHLWYLLRRMRNEKPHRFGGGVRINSFFPPYPSAALDRFCRAVIERRRAPLSTYLAVTHRCPYRCEHCSCAGRGGAEMGTAKMLDLIGQIKALGTCTLGLTGGEPLGRGDLEEMIAAAGPEMATIVFTTGAGLDAARAARLAGAGVTCVTVGVESADPAEHDAARGASGSFEQAREAVAACRAAGIYPAISTVATRPRLAGGGLERMYDLAGAWGAREFRILSAVATGRWAGRGDQMLSPAEMQALRDFHVRHNRRRAGPAVACFAYLEGEDLFGCGAGFHHLFIDAAGEVCPCDLTPLSLGSAAEEPLAEVWGRMGEFFPRPRRGCLMAGLAGRLGGGPLPLDRQRSEALCRSCPPAGPLPEGYRRLLGQKVDRLIG